MEKEQAKTFTRKLDLVGKTSLGYEDESGHTNPTDPSEQAVKAKGKKKMTPRKRMHSRVALPRILTRLLRSLSLRTTSMKAAVGEPAVNRKREDHPIARKKQAYSPLRSLLTSSFRPFQGPLLALNEERLVGNHRENALEILRTTGLVEGYVPHQSS
ncbi:unnamed protein product [Ilex paraguariensis]|uniref:Uncharacterized protein n=1 Tax=Ilex paraguariensis TaxID=185542 RepID=A0ABC8TW91_9AQUA